jgi:molybdenum cofactor biosynthesis enzyme MoaA
LLIDNVGVNTNGISLKDRLVDALLTTGIDVIVVGIDYFGSKISKASNIGKSSIDILNNVLNAKTKGLNIQVATVYDERNHEDVFQLAKWCKDNNILLKILEVSDDTIAPETSEPFIQLIQDLRDNFCLKLGKTISLNEIYGMHDDGINKILFFHSKCRVRECQECSQMHMRVTSSGMAKPCILRRDTEFDLLDSEKAFNNMARAVHNLGNPPEKAAK